MTTRPEVPVRGRRFFALKILGPAILALALVAASGGGARAQMLLDLHGGILAGGTTGGGNAGNTDFFHQTQGPGFGAEVGIRLLILDLSIRFLQMVDAHGREGTMSTLMLGPTMEIPIQGGGLDIHNRRRPVKLVVRPGLAAGLGFGTPAPVNPPLSADQISAKGLLVMGRFGVERLIGPFLGVGAELEGGYHYLLGGNGLLNGQADHSTGWQFGGFAMLTFHLGI